MTDGTSNEEFRDLELAEYEQAIADFEFNLDEYFAELAQGQVKEFPEDPEKRPFQGTAVLLNPMLGSGKTRQALVGVANRLKKEQSDLEQAERELALAEEEVSRCAREGQMDTGARIEAGRARQRVEELKESASTFAIFTNANLLSTQNINDLRALLEGTGLIVDNYYGMTYVSPQKKAICQKLEDVLIIQKAGGDTRLLCRVHNKSTGEVSMCEHYATCNYYNQLYPGRPIPPKKVKQEDIPRAVGTTQPMLEKPIGPFHDKVFTHAILDDATSWTDDATFKVADLLAALRTVVTYDNVYTAAQEIDLYKSKGAKMGWSDADRVKQWEHLAQTMSDSAGNIAYALEKVQDDPGSDVYDQVPNRLNLMYLPDRKAVHNLYMTLRFILKDEPPCGVYPNMSTQDLKQWENMSDKARHIKLLLAFLPFLHAAMGHCTRGRHIHAARYFQVEPSKKDDGKRVQFEKLRSPHSSLSGSNTEFLINCATSVPLIAESVFEEVNTDYWQDTEWEGNPFAPYIRVLHDSGWSVASLVDLETGEPTLLLLEVVDLIKAKAKQHYAEGRKRGRNYDVFVGAPKKVIEAIKDLVPDTVALRNTDSVDGVNEWLDTPVFFLLSRSLPKPGELQLTAEAYARQVIPIKNGSRWDWRDYLEVPNHGDPIRQLREPYHEDPYMDAVLRSRCHAGAIQLDRSRHFWRTEENKAEIYIMHELSTRQPIDRHVSWEQLSSSYMKMAMEVGFVPDPEAGPKNPVGNVAHAAMPERWLSAERAQVELKGFSYEGLELPFTHKTKFWFTPPRDKDDKRRAVKAHVIVDAPTVKEAAEVVRKVFPDMGDNHQKNERRNGKA